MAQFKDTTGRPWTFELSVGEVLRVKKETGVNLAELFSRGSKEGDKLADPEMLVNIAWELVKAQAAGMEPEAFAFVLNGETLEAIADSLGEAVADFFPRRRILLRKVMVKAQETMTLLEQEELKRLDQIDPKQEADKLVKKAIARRPKAKAKAA